MNEVLQAFRNAIQDLFRTQVLIMVLTPIVAAMMLWTLIGWLIWTPLTEGLSAWLASTSPGKWLSGWSQGTLWFLSNLLALGLIVPCVLITVMVITEFFTMPGLVNFVAQKYYPRLERRRGGTVMGGITNSVVSIALFVLLWLATLPLWFTGIGAVLVPVFSAAFLNQRIFRHDAASDHASGEELRALKRSHPRRLFALGLLPSLFLLVPLANLLVPALTGLAFTHYQLQALARLRGQPT